MPPGRRDIPTEEELERMRQANASYRIGKDRPSTSFGNDGLVGVFTRVLETLGEKALSPVIKDIERYASEQNNKQDQLEYQNSRLAPSRYYESLPSMKQAVLSDMAMGYMPSADAMEGIREQRRMESPGVFYTEGAKQPTEDWSTLNPEYADRRTYTELAPPRYRGQTTGQFEKPLFIVGDFTQDKVEQRTPIQRSGSLDSFLFNYPSGQDVSNYLSTVIKNLKNDEGILVRSNGYNAVGLDQPPYMVVTKRDGIVYQREIYPDEYDSFRESFITGYPAGNEQIKIDEISSRSMYPRTQFDKILNTLPQSEKSKLRQLSYMDLAFGPEGYVAYNPAVPGSAINMSDSPVDSNLPSYYEFYGDERNPQTEYVFIHELAHAFAEKPEGKSLSNTREFTQVQDNDAKESAKFIGKVNLINYGYYDTLLGEKGITEYGRENGPSEDLAERFAYYTLDKMGTPIAEDVETGDVVRFAEIYPWSAAFFDKYLVGRNARRN